MKRSRGRSCFWAGCPKAVRPSMLCCRDPWYRLPKAVRDRIWAAYRPGQEEDGVLSPAYVEALREVRAFVARAEGRAEDAAAIDSQGRLFQ